MLEKIRQIIGRLNEKAFVIGMLLAFAFIFILFSLNDIRDLFLLVVTLPGFFILQYSMFPDTKFAKYGKFFFDLQRYLKRADTKKIVKANENYDKNTIKSVHEPETYDISSERITGLFPFLITIADKLSPALGVIHGLLKPVFSILWKICWKPLCFLLFCIGVFYKILVQWPYRSIAFILIGMPAYLFLYVRFDLGALLEISLPLGMQLNLAVILMFVFLFLPLIIYTLLLWSACKVGFEKEAKILGIPKSWKPSYIEYSYEHMGILYDYVMPASSHFMTPFGQLDSQKEDFEQSGKIDPLNLAGHTTLIINTSFPQVHCLKGGMCQTVYRYFNGATIAEIKGEI